MASLNVKANANSMADESLKEHYLSSSLKSLLKAKKLKNKILNTINKL